MGGCLIWLLLIRKYMFLHNNMIYCIALWWTWFWCWFCCDCDYSYLSAHHRGLLTSAWSTLSQTYIFKSVQYLHKWMWPFWWHSSSFPCKFLEKTWVQQPSIFMALLSFPLQVLEIRVEQPPYRAGDELSTCWAREALQFLKEEMWMAPRCNSEMWSESRSSNSNIIQHLKNSFLLEFPSSWSCTVQRGG